MSFYHGLVIGDTLTHEEIADIFKNNKQKGVKYSKETNTLVIISNHVESIYNDRWVEGEFHYTGMGVDGNQKIERENKRIAKSKEEGIEVYLFEIFESKKCTFMGQIELVSEPYQEEQNDFNGNERLVWMFPFKSLEKQTELSIPISTLSHLEIHNEKKARRLSDNEIQTRAKKACEIVGTRQSTVTHYQRNIYVSEYAKRRANGYCELCEEPAPFINKDGIPFLETHHIVWLSKGGQDSIQNTVALCPNCHRMMHSLNLKEDVEKLTKIAFHPLNNYFE
ncbi:HNH endonuclease [Neobacillus sp.]|uniref:HNH endonuclease n=1 Tax=Neobacillus sp. TaxID=2675273 RepID=UPI002898BF01|nr:HNH endonuclease [Neobacillus sp.]